MKRKPYPKYKPSGVEWLGDVPENWAAQGVKFCYSIQLGKMLQPEPASPTDEETLYLKSQHVQWGYVRVADLPTMWTNKKERRQYAVKDGDLLVCEGGDVGRAAVVRDAPDGTIIQNALHRVRPQGENENGFLLYVLAHAESQGWFEIICNKSTIAHFTVDKFGALGVALPTPAEQRAIAAFLDRETGRIETLISKKRELVERLKEKRTALISSTVTRGLPAEAAAKAGLPVNPPLKPSGHPWLDDIPKHWEVKRLKEVSVLFGRIGFRGYSTDDLVYEGEGAISMSPSNMAEGVMNLDKCTWLSWEKYHESPEIQVQPEDVIMVKTGSTLGKTAFVHSVPVPMTVNPQLMIFKEVKCSKRFLFYYVFSKVVQDVIPLHNTGSTIPTMTQEGIGKLPFPHPPLPEQAAIASYLDAETAKLDTLVAKIEEAVERLQEYRTALITAAVTGKIDVRGNAIALRHV